MGYELFCSAEGPPTSAESPRGTWVVKADCLGAALKAACKLIGEGVTVWKLKGSTGFTMERTDIEAERLRRLQPSGQRRKKTNPR